MLSRTLSSRNFWKYLLLQGIFTGWQRNIDSALWIQKFLNKWSNLNCFKPNCVYFSLKWRWKAGKAKNPIILCSRMCLLIVLFWGVLFTWIVSLLITEWWWRLAIFTLEYSFRKWWFVGCNRFCNNQLPFMIKLFSEKVKVLNNVSLKQNFLFLNTFEFI